MVVITAAIGYCLGTNNFSTTTFLALLLGTWASSGGASALNQYLERQNDSLMERTKKRPIPSGLIDPEKALLFGVALSLLGVFLLVTQINLLTGFIALLTVFLYVFLYTPLKQISAYNTVIGAIPGALPPLGGWAAGAGQIELGAWVLFLIMFVWQHPHFYAIAWMYKDEYEKGGFKMLPSVSPSGTLFAIVSTALLLFVISLIPAFIGLSGVVYPVGATALGLLMIYYCFKMFWSPTRSNAKTVMFASLIYLPAVLGLLLLPF
jgi:protoheme IX farnesyltransferase